MGRNRRLPLCVDEVGVKCGWSKIKLEMSFLLPNLLIIQSKQNQYEKRPRKFSFRRSQTNVNILPNTPMCLVILYSLLWGRNST